MRVLKQVLCYYDFFKFFIGFVSPEDNFRSDSAFVADLAEAMKSLSLSWQEVFPSNWIGFLVSWKTQTFCLHKKRFLSVAKFRM